MATSPDHPGLPFVQASGYTSGRPDGLPIWIVIHDMEAHETPTTAEGTANYFATGAGGRQVSSHYCVDNNSVVQCVRLGDCAWTVGNRPGNNRGINWELSGFASQTREQWLDPFGVAMFAQMAPIVRADAAKYRIPLRKLSVVELKAYTPGVTSHYELGLAFGGTDHTDPGPNFPWDYFIGLMNGTAQEEEMDPLLVTDQAGQAWICDMHTFTRRKVDADDVKDVAFVLANPGKFQNAEKVQNIDAFGRPASSGGGGGLTYDEAAQAAFEGAQRAERE